MNRTQIVTAQILTIKAAYPKTIVIIENNGYYLISCGDYKLIPEKLHPNFKKNITYKMPCFKQSFQDTFLREVVKTGYRVAQFTELKKKAQW